MEGEDDMIARPTHWRATADGRESVAGPGGHASLERLARNGATSGRITSRPAYTREELEALAYRYRVTVATIRHAIDHGLLETLDAS